MKKNEIKLTDMKQKKSKRGNIYFEGQYEDGKKIILRQVSTKEGKIWRLFWINR